MRSSCVALFSCCLVACTQGEPGEIGGYTGADAENSTSAAEVGGSSEAEASSGDSDGEASSEAEASTDEGSDGPLLDVVQESAEGGGPEGQIPATCTEAENSNSTVGCEFYAVDMDLVVVYDELQYAVAVANVQLDQSASVVVEVDDGNGWEVVAGPVEIEALDLHTFELPGRHINASGVRYGGAYRVTSDVPIVAYQFEPLEAGESFTSDAALLYPTTAWDTLHYVLNQPKINDAQESYFTIVASTDGTIVTVTPSVDTEAGPDIPAGTAGQPFEIMLDDGDMAQVATAPELGDPTGTRIESNEGHPVAVFTGNTCAMIPDGAGACDHLQDQMFGVRLWGTDFVASRIPVRSTALSSGSVEPSVWQILASEDDTEVSFEGGGLSTGLPASPQTLQAGEVLNLTVTGPFEDPGDFLVSSTKPIAVANYMTGSTTVAGGPDLGDPSQVQLAPIDQFLDRYVVLVPDVWLVDMVTITRRAGSEVRIDDVPIPDEDFVAVGSMFEVARVELSDGVHTMDGALPFSAVIVGFDDDDSYAYLGGAGTIIINPDPG